MNPPSQCKSKLSRVGRVLGKSLRILAWICVGYLVVLSTCTALRVGFRWCPLHFASFKARQIVPVRYCLFPVDDSLEKELREGKVLLGGRMAGPIGGFCPYRHWPVLRRR